MQSGTEEEFVRALTRAQTPLRGYVMSLTSSIHEAEDILQDVNAVLWTKWGEFDRSKPFLNWAFGVARFTILKQRRQCARHPLCIDSELVEAAAESFIKLERENSSRASHLAKCIEQLQPDHRETLRMRYEEELSSEELARRTGKSAAAVQTLLSRLRSTLEECAGKLARAEHLS